MQTPTVSFKLDDSELMRLEKLRSRLKLSHWERIKKRYLLEADDGVAKTNGDLETNNPVEYDDKYANWSNRYSDFSMKWTKIRNVNTNVIEGHLIATGRPRLEHLGKIGLGCRVSLMHGPIMNEPLPTTKVGDLRINHLHLEIRFDQPVEIKVGDEKCTIFKVGHENKLYGETARETNLMKFKEKKEQKNGTTEDILRTLVQGIATLLVEDRRDGRRYDEDELDVDEAHRDDPNLNRSPSQFRSGRDGHGISNWLNRNVGQNHPRYHQNIKPTTEME